MKKLEALTPEQEQLMHATRQQWLDRFFSGKTKLDREKATEGINWLYEFSGLPKPMIIYLDSPLACQYAANMLSQNFGAKVRDEVGAKVRAEVWAKVRAEVRAEVGAKVGDEVRAEVGAERLEFFSFAYYGSVSDYGWVSFYHFFSQIGLINHLAFNQFQSLLESGVYDMIQFRNVCIVSALPTAVHRDGQNRLHSTTQSAIAFPDGYELYFIHGRAVHGWIVQHPETITPNQFLLERNSELRAAMYEVLGQERVLELLGARQIHSQEVFHANGEKENLTLYHTHERFAELDNNPLAWVRFTCPSTGTNYLIDCEPKHLNVIDAAKSTRPDIFEFGEAYSWNYRS